MAKKKAPNQESEEESSGTVRRGRGSQMWIHEGQAQWLRDNDFDIDNMTPEEIISVAHGRRNDWRGSDEYKALKAEHDASVREEKEARAANRAEAKAAKEEKKASKTKSAKKAAPKKAAPKGRKAASKKASSDEGESEDPFE